MASPPENETEKPALSESEQKEKYKCAQPENLPDEGTDRFRELERFCKEVMIILQTVNKNEYRAALTYMEPPTAQFSKAVVFPMTSMVVGFFARKKTALIQAKPGAKVGDFVQDAIKAYPNARFVIGIGVCYSFDRQKYKMADVLVSETICDNTNKKFNAQGQMENRGQTIDVVYALTKIFCMEEDEEIGFVVSDAGREAKVYHGKFCCDPCLVNSMEMRSKYLEANPGAMGGEMEGGELLKFDRSGKIEGGIVIKGVADYGDGTNDKSWQFIASMAALHYTESQLRNVPSKELCPTSVNKTELPMVSHIETDGPSEESAVRYYQNYVSRLPDSTRKYLDCQLDWGNKVEADLHEISKELVNWEEVLSGPMKLTKSEVYDIKHGSNQVSSLLQRREVLRKWKDKMLLRATYGNLLHLFVSAGHSDGAEAVIQVLLRK